MSFSVLLSVGFLWVGFLWVGLLWGGEVDVVGLTVG